MVFESSKPLNCWAIRLCFYRNFTPRVSPTWNPLDPQWELIKLWNSSLLLKQRVILVWCLFNTLAIGPRQEKTNTCYGLVHQQELLSVNPKTLVNSRFQTCCLGNSSGCLTYLIISYMMMPFLSVGQTFGILDYSGRTNSYSVWGPRIINFRFLKSSWRVSL